VTEACARELESVVEPTEGTRASTHAFPAKGSVGATTTLRSCSPLDAAGLLAEREALRAGLEELLDVAERIRGGDTNLDPERWYAARDFARHVLINTSEPPGSPPSPSDAACSDAAGGV
jgi:hypothetical protein